MSRTIDVLEKRARPDFRVAGQRATFTDCPLFLFPRVPIYSAVPDHDASDALVDLVRLCVSKFRLRKL